MSSKKCSPLDALERLRLHLLERQSSGQTQVLLTNHSLAKLKGFKEKIVRSKEINSDSSSRNPTASAKQVLLDRIKKDAASCPKCRGLKSLRQKMVFASGNPDSDIMFVGEAPGKEEENQGLPFVGPSGQLLTKIIKAMGINREDVYISNIVKFRPKVESKNQGAANRKPTSEEMSASLEYILAEIEVVQPKLVVALGGTAMEGLLAINGSVASARGKLHDLGNCKAMITYHPSYLLRSRNSKQDKRKVWEDILMAMEYLNMPISPKQRSFFE